MSSRIVRLFVFTATLLTTVGFAWWCVDLLAEDGLSAVEYPLVAVQTLLVSLIAFSFWLAVVGCCYRLTRWNNLPNRVPLVDRAKGRTAVLMPVYNENPQEVFNRIEAMRHSLEGIDADEKIDFFVLSDTNDPSIAAEEEIEWSKLQRGGMMYPVYYRRREENVGRKAGNIQDFCVNWGLSYDYLVTLDADSLMSGDTLVHMIRRMEAAPQLGLLQTVPVPVNQTTIWARCQQFAAVVYGPIFVEGFSQFAGDAGNYWGHNAILRREAFMKNCGLSKLPGEAPLGGEILSHDFIEAALLRRAGYGVRLDGDLKGSYEECPPSLPTFAGRDRRWCQGNLQHLQIAIRGKLTPLSRMYLLLGVLAYVASPLWLLTIVLGLVALADVGQAAMPRSIEWIALFATVMTMILLPRVMAVGTIVVRGETEQHRGVFRLIASTLIETLISIITAPIMMLYHSVFVATTLAGRVVKWNAQARDVDRLSWSESCRAHGWQMATGVVAVIVLVILQPAAAVWLSPILVGLVFAVPVSVLLASSRLGDRLGRCGLLTTPVENHPPQELRTLKQLQLLRDA